VTACLRAVSAGCALAVALLVLAARPAAAQAPGRGGGAADVIRRGLVHGGARPPVGFYDVLARRPRAFQFAHGWLARARRVRERRAALRRAGMWSSLRAPAAVAGASAAATAAVSGTLRYPTLLPLFSNTDTPDSALMDPAAVQSELWGTAPAPPYSVTTYYQEISGGLLTVTGTVLPPIRLAQTDTFFEGGPECQGLCASSRIPELIDSLLVHADSTVDFAQFADSATDTVPAIVILDPQVGGECYQLYPPAINSIWAHRFSLSGWGGAPFVTHDSLNGRPVVIDDYIIQGGQGGGAGAPYPGCTPGVLAPIGIVAHETGHLFGLPDLYDTFSSTEGVGRWDLMGSGNEQKPWRPAHMSAWSLATLGWVTEVPITASQTDTAQPIETGRTAYLVPLADSGPNEFFVLENRQPIGSDSMLYGPGLMIYHLDTLLMQQRLADNTVNALWPHALAVEEAAGDTGLDCTYPALCNDRGDAGDPFPGSAGNAVFGPGTRPAALTNAGGFAGLMIDSIAQLAPFGAMRFRVTFGALTQVAASDTSAAVLVDSVATHRYRSILAGGSRHAIAIDSVQLSGDRRTQYLFRSWSDGGARAHAITASSAGGAYTADVARRFRVNLTIRGAGAVAASTPLDTAGTYLAEAATDTLRAVADAGSAFAGWTADTVTGSSLVILRVARPYALVATFVGTADVLRQLLTGSSSLDAGQLLSLDYLGNDNRRFDLGDFVAWLDRTPDALAASRAAPRKARP
jgi:M6 family metalloprotease-like protein